MHYFTADLIFTNVSEPLSDHVIVTDDTGKILALTPTNQVSADVIKINGAIVPGFVNAHCHLELSHFKNKLETGNGLVPFIKSIITQRDASAEIIQDAIATADQEMYENGIVAVGDISNKLDTFKTKQESKINYYTFVEMFDFIQEDQAQKTFEEYLKIYQGQSDTIGNKKSCVPHAPYSVSKKLFELINKQNDAEATVSIHNQETVHENLFFQEKKGELLDFFKESGNDYSDFEATGHPSIDYAIDHMDPSLKTLFIHNTLSDEKDIQKAHNWNDKSYWVTCPNANLFIENRLPRYQAFINENAKMGVGTDSLSSNWQLSILEEIKTIQRFQSFLNTTALIKWSSFHSAKALGYNDVGSIEKGKKPGLVALEGLSSPQSLLKDVTSVRRLL